MSSALFYQTYEPFWPLLTGFVFVVGACIGSFLNVVIWRVPRGESIVTAPSHCPSCNHGIAWYQNIPIVAWLMLRGRCRNCKTPISPRYITVETLTGIFFLLFWWNAWPHTGANGAGGQPLPMLASYLFLVALLIAITYIDFDHMIIPDGLNLCGLVVAFAFAILLPGSHDLSTDPHALSSLSHKSPLFQGFVIIAYQTFPGIIDSARLLAVIDLFLGIVFGGGVLWLLAEGGKAFFGTRRVRLHEPVTMTLTPRGFHTVDDGDNPWDDVFLRETDVMSVVGRLTVVQWKRGKGLVVEPIIDMDGDIVVRIDEHYIHFGDDAVAMEHIKEIQMTTSEWSEPREVMGGGDVKLLGVLGAFLGPGGAVFILCMSSILGALGGAILMALSNTKLYTRIPFGPYIAGAAVIYMLFGDHVVSQYLHFFMWLSNNNN